MLRESRMVSLMMQPVGIDLHWQEKQKLEKQDGGQTTNRKGEGSSENLKAGLRACF
jgi:hypothetical protein